MLTSITLSIYSSRHTSGSVLRNVKPAATRTQPPPTTPQKPPVLPQK